MEDDQKMSEQKITPISDYHFKTSRQESHYFSESYLLSEKIMREIEEEKSFASPEEEKAMQAQLSADCQEIMEHAVAEKNRIMRVPNPASVRLFEELAEAAHVLAEACLLDVVTEISEKGIGKIQIRFEYMFLMDDMPMDMKALFATLFAVCSNMSMGAISEADYKTDYKYLSASKKPHITEICLYYDLYRELEKKSTLSIL